MLNWEEFMNIRDLAKQGASISEIARVTGKDRKTVKKYLLQKAPPGYRPRPKVPSKIDPFRSYVKERTKAGMTNSVKMLREIKERGYDGGITVLRQFMRPIRDEAERAVMRFETEPGHQAQVDWGYCGKIYHEGKVRPLYCFVMTLGWSRASYLELTVSQNVKSFMRCHMNAFTYFGGTTSEILYDNIKTVVITRALENTHLHSEFKDFSSHYGFIPRLCRAYRPQTKGKVESGIKYVKRSFLLGETFSSLEDANQRAMTWLETVANIRVHGTTDEVPNVRLKQENLTPLSFIRPYDISTTLTRRVSLDCLVSFEGCRYSVPHEAARKDVEIREDGGMVRIYLLGELIAVHARAKGKRTMILPAHYKGIALSSSLRPQEATIHGLSPLPDVEVRDLLVYEEVGN